MPVYQYECQTCGEQFEELVPFSETNPERPCPRCESTDTRKMITSFATSSGINSGSSSSSSCASSGSRFT